MQEDISMFTDGRSPVRLRELAKHASELASIGCTESARQALLRAAQEMRDEAKAKEGSEASVFGWEPARTS